MTISTKFVDPSLTGRELHNIASACFGGTLGEDGECAKSVVSRLKEIYPGSSEVVVTTSVGSSFDLVADLVKINPGDEVILPSFTFVSAANAFAKRGARLRFVDVESAYLNISPRGAAEAINEKTRVIIVPHYAGIASDVTAFIELAAKRGILLVEDLTGAFLARSPSGILGKFGDFACGSFHEDEFVHSGEGGFLLVNNGMYGETCKVLKFRGTNKMLFQEGKAEHYGWIGLGGEYCANEITCAFLSAQLERAEIYFDARTAVWLRYQQLLSNFDKNHLIDYVSDRVSAGNFYIKVPKGANRSEILSGMRRIGIDCRNHFYPLHLTKAGRDYGYFDRRLPVTEVEHERVIRLPSHIKVSEAEQERVIKILLRLVENSQSESQNA